MTVLTIQLELNVNIFCPNKHNRNFSEFFPEVQPYASPTAVKREMSWAHASTMPSESPLRHSDQGLHRGHKYRPQLLRR